VKPTHGSLFAPYDFYLHLGQVTGDVEASSRTHQRPAHHDRRAVHQTGLRAVIRPLIILPGCVPQAGKRLLAATPQFYAANKLYENIRLPAASRWAMASGPAPTLARTGCGKSYHHAVSQHACLMKSVEFGSPTIVLSPTHRIWTTNSRGQFTNAKNYIGGPDGVKCGEPCTPARVSGPQIAAAFVSHHPFTNFHEDTELLLTSAPECVSYPMKQASQPR